MSFIKKFFLFFGNKAIKVIDETKSILTFIGELSLAALSACASPKKIRWNDTAYYMRLCGTSATPIAILICFSMGLILGFQGALQLHKYGGDIFLADAVGMSIVLELGPLMIAMVAIGRAGSAFAAEIATMKVSEEIDAMTTMGFITSRFLIIPKLIAMLIIMPILTVFGDIAGVLGGLCVGVFQLGIPIQTYLNRTLIAIKPTYFLEGLIKSVIFAIIITAIGCLRGFEAKKDAQGVGRAATSAVVSGIFLIILADTLLTLVFRVIFS